MQEVNDGNFEAEVINFEGTVLVKYGASWCKPCQNLAPRLENIISQVDAKITEVDIDANFESSVRNAVRSIPTMILYKNGEVLKEARGCSKMTEDEIKDFINA